MKKTILVVEDDLDIQDYLELILADDDWEILRAYDGKEALAVIDSGRAVNLVLLDVIMPIMDGETFFRELRIARKDPVPVVLTSVDENIANRIKAIGSVHGVFLKGTRGTDLKAMIKGLLK